MSLLRRAHDIMPAKANRTLGAAERPDEVLDLSNEKMLEQLTQVRCCLVDTPPRASGSSFKGSSSSTR